ncbi:MAG: carboxypeptidase regulatory-like domain-containing protein [Acidimicrobiia bacterium]|nr:carboxypeptidase regulatory-like domain-containing protein [Acidimicrobiia bacterium]
MVDRAERRARAVRSGIDRCAGDRSFQRARTFGPRRDRAGVYGPPGPWSRGGDVSDCLWPGQHDRANAPARRHRRVIGRVSGRQLQSDTGSLSGQVTRDGVPVYGAHVVAFSPRTGTLVGNFTLNTRGQFSIGGLAPGAYIVRVEPIDDADVASFLADEPSVDVDLRATIHDRVIVVPRGGDSGNTVIEVSSK